MCFQVKCTAQLTGVVPYKPNEHLPLSGLCGLPQAQACQRLRYSLKSRGALICPGIPTPDLVVGCLIDKCAWPLQSRSHSSAAMALKARLLRLVQGDPELHIAPKFLKAHSEQRILKPFCNYP